MTTHTKVNGQYKRIYNAWMKVDGLWKLLDSIYYKQTVWRRVHYATRVFEFSRTLTGITYNYNLRNDLLANGWDGFAPVQVVITVSEGAIVASTTAFNYAFNTGGSYNSGSNITVINRGTICGKGGNGGEGSMGSPSSDGYKTVGSAGEPGGPAMFVGVAITLINFGVIGGGGGGGGGGGWAYAYMVEKMGGVGGGGGQGYVPGRGGRSWYHDYTGWIPDGNNGSITSPGSSYPTSDFSGQGDVNYGGGNGGAFGQAGGNGDGTTSGGGPGFPGGAGGPAIVGIANVTLTNTGSIQGVQV